MGTIEQKVDYLKETKQAIRAAIEEKGVSVADTDTFRSYASKIGTISGGGGGTKWYVGDFYSGQMYEGNNGDLFLNTGQMDRGVVLQFQDGTWNPVGSILGPQGENGVDGTDGSIAPVGSIVIWGSEDIPENYLKCEGQTLSRGEYASLFNVIGTTFGEGDGATTFALPDMRNYVVVGMSDDTDINAIGKKYGEKEVTLGTEHIPPHKHDTTGGTYENTGAPYYWLAARKAVGDALTVKISSDNTGGGQPHNNMQPSMAMVFIIKAYEITPANVNVVDNLDGNSTTDAPSVHAVNTKLESITQKDNGPAGKYISLLKGSSQTVTAEKIFDVSWDGEENNNTDGILIKDGNMIKCTQGSHTILINVTLQCILTNPAVGDSVYIYIRKVVDGEVSEFKTTDAAIRDPHISVITEINAGESILIQSYATKDVNVTGSSVWNTFQIMLIN